MLFTEQLRALSHSSLFRGLTAGEIEDYLSHIGVKPLTAEAGKTLVYQGEENRDVFVLISGRAVGERLFHEGKEATINEFAAGAVFGDVISGGDRTSPVNVRTAEDSELLRIPFDAVVSGAAASPAGERVLLNLIEEISGKYFALMSRLNMLLCPSLRGKIAAYLLGCAEREKSAVFECPHSREEQAKLLNCDRSALSRELSRMKMVGLIDYSGRRFELLNVPELELLV